MTIDFAAFTPASAFGGGMLIGLAAALLILLNGRIAGISGILGGLLRPGPGETGWRIAFLVGMVLAPVGWALVATLPAIDIDASYPVLIAAGLIVGISTRYGGGCISGYGVCGLSRLSPRSLVATLAFMASGFATVFLIRHVLGG